jgi:signal transduction histidine kinase
MTIPNAPDSCCGCARRDKAALTELRDLVRGFHPAILEDRGLDAALSAIVARAPVPVDLHVGISPRPPATIESAAYYVVVEALTNTAKHSHVTKASIAIARRGDRLAIDDGRRRRWRGRRQGHAVRPEDRARPGGWTALSPPGDRRRFS